MKRLFTQILSFFLLLPTLALAQEQNLEGPKQGHTNQNKFRQLYNEFSTPNDYRTASGAPGAAYYQQRADYVMDIKIDDETQRLYGEETITYTNNSPDVLAYLWVQLDQNIRKKDSPSLLKNSQSMDQVSQLSTFANNHLGDPFDGGFNIEHVLDAQGKPLPYIINQTMMRIDLPTPLQSGGQVSFSIKWWYNINNHVVNRARSGYEYFPKDNNRAYVIAQFFPRMCMYDDVEGRQNYQFWGNGEFALPFGDYEVNLTVPANFIVDATGELTNRKEVFTKEMMSRYKKAKQAYDKPVMIVTQQEAEANEKTTTTKTKTWKFSAKNVRDYGFTASKKYIWDMMAVKVGDRDVMAVSLYPKEGNPLWEEWSTRAVAQTLETVSRYTFDYPYHKAISVHAKNQGMEYPMICWNYGRPEEDGTYSDRVKFGMISVIIHEIGHNYFPMIVNSDERQWGWMDEGLTTFIQYLTEQEFGQRYPESIPGLDKYPSRRGEAKKIVPYMSDDQDFLAPIMSNPENVFQLGPNAYGKPATALNILRETIMGHELFDYAFKTYSQRWMFKHPTPEDFFRSMEDASAVDLDWFWRGWFYTTDFVDIGVESLNTVQMTSQPPAAYIEILKSFGYSIEDLPPLVFRVNEDDEDYDENAAPFAGLDAEDYLDEAGLTVAQENLEKTNYLYEVTFNKPGGLVMPILVEYTYADGSTLTERYPVQIWRKNDDSYTRLLASEKEIVGVQVDPNEETADVNTTNNSWPRTKVQTDFDRFKETN
ncbi:MAG: M1 family metallopeptidase [Bacteroidota bacterium]|nr:M1 family metallopeptidase [Bacteroidota bacterium]